MGLHIGMPQGLLSVLVAEEAPANLRATALACSIRERRGLLLVSLIAGFLLEQIGPAATFVAGAGLPAAGFCALVFTQRKNFEWSKRE